jgi:hypothetical protein
MRMHHRTHPQELSGIRGIHTPFFGLGVKEADLFQRENCEISMFNDIDCDLISTTKFIQAMLSCLIHLK